MCAIESCVFKSRHAITKMVSSTICPSQSSASFVVMQLLVSWQFAAWDNTDMTHCSLHSQMLENCCCNGLCIFTMSNFLQKCINIDINKLATCNFGGFHLTMISGTLILEGNPRQKPWHCSEFQFLIMLISCWTIVVVEVSESEPLRNHGDDGLAISAFVSDTCLPKTTKWSKYKSVILLTVKLQHDMSSSNETQIPWLPELMISQSSQIMWAENEPYLQ